MTEPAATIIIPNFNGRAFLPRLMESLDAQRRRDFVICVVDDRSTDDSAEWIRRHRPDVGLIVNERNMGFAASCNAGLRVATTPFVALLNNDTHVAPDWLDRALARFDDPTVGAVQSLVLLAGPPHRIDSAGDLYTVAGGAVKRMHGRPRDWAEDASDDIFSCCAASAFYRRDALQQVGLLDDSFVSYYEDVELGFRMQWAGWRCVLARDSICYHHLNSSYAPDGWAMHYHSSRNAEIVWWGHLSFGLRLRYLPAHLSFLALQFGAEVLHGRAGSYLAGKWAALCAPRKIAALRAGDRRIARVSPRRIRERMSRNWWELLVRPRLRKLLRRPDPP
jgi:GT2 family glycosyltransferase